MLLRQLSDDNKKLFYTLEMLLANADGICREEEKKLIQNHCEEMGLESVDYDEKIKLEEILASINSQMSKKEKKIIFIELISTALVDGEYHEKEKKLIKSLRNILQIPEEVSEQAVDLMQKLFNVSKEVENFVEW